MGLGHALTWTFYAVAGGSLAIGYFTSPDAPAASVQEVLYLEERCYKWPFHRSPCFLVARTSADHSVTFEPQPASRSFRTQIDPWLYPSTEQRLHRTFPGLKVSTLSAFISTAPWEQTFDHIFKEVIGHYTVLARNHLLEYVIARLPPMVRANLAGREQTYEETNRKLLGCLQNIARKSSGFALYNTVQTQFHLEDSIESTLLSYFRMDIEGQSSPFSRLEKKLRDIFGPEIIPFLTKVSDLNELFELERRRDSLELAKKEATDAKRSIELGDEYF